MENNIIGREDEKRKLTECYNSDSAELVAVYGRRRVGKTYLIKQFLGDSFTFYATGIYEGNLDEQLHHWQSQLKAYSGKKNRLPKNWFEAFDQLKDYLSSLSDKRLVVFLDEFPWFDTRKSRFLKAFELFWNSWGADQNNLMFIVCGSATTWMTGKLLGNKGGLHNRVTRQIYLRSFTLQETAAFLKSRGISYTPYQVVETYMVLGGIPYYLKLLQKGKSVSHNIDNLLFAENAELREEFDLLFRSLFDDANMYMRVVEVLSSKNIGLTRNEIISELSIQKGGNITTVLDNLVRCDFVRPYQAFGKIQRDTIYQLVDLFSLFYLRFLKGKQTYDEHRWSNMQDDPSRRAWSGYAFEQVCLLHLSQIKKALGISGVQTKACSWVYKSPEQSAQIDLVIDRRDDVINLCEMKFSKVPFEITKDYAMWLEERKELFRSRTKTRKSLFLTMVCPEGLKQNMYADDIQNVVTLDDLMK